MAFAESIPKLDLRRSMIATALLGVGVMAALDEIVFHQILAWHHFFDWGTPAFALFSDGLLHSAELILFVLGFFMFADLRAVTRLPERTLGLGFFLVWVVSSCSTGSSIIRCLGCTRSATSITSCPMIWHGTALVFFCW